MWTNSSAATTTGPITDNYTRKYVYQQETDSFLLELQQFYIKYHLLKVSTFHSVQFAILDLPLFGERKNYHQLLPLFWLEMVHMMGLSIIIKEKSVGKHVFPPLFAFPMRLKCVPKIDIGKLPPCIIHHFS